MKSRTRRIILVLGAILLIPISYFVIALVAFGPNRLVIRNSGGSEVRDIQITLRAMDGRVILREAVHALAPAESISFRHSSNDLSAELQFVIGDQTFSYHEPYIDLWRGEGWVYEIESGGALRSGFESVGPQQLVPRDQ